METTFSNSIHNTWAVIRTIGSGVWFGQVDMTLIDAVPLPVRNARRLWRWRGAKECSDLALNGVAEPEDCLVPPMVPTVYVWQVCELIPMSQAAYESLSSIPVWTSHGEDDTP